MISEGPCDTEDWSNGCRKFSFAIRAINYILKYIEIENLKLNCHISHHYYFLYHLLFTVLTLTSIRDLIHFSKLMTMFVCVCVCVYTYICIYLSVCIKKLYTAHTCIFLNIYCMCVYVCMYVKCLIFLMLNIGCSHLCFFGPTLYCFITHSPHISHPQSVFAP